MIRFAQGDDAMAIADRLREARYKAGLTQSEAAEKLYVTRQLISKWEHGICEPTASTLVRCAQLYQVRLDYLCCLTDEDSEGTNSLLSSANYKWKALIRRIMATLAARKRMVLSGIFILALAISIGWIVGSHGDNAKPQEEVPTYNQDELPTSHLEPPSEHFK